MPDGTDTARAMKRRGILAAAGAVVAGIMAKQAAQPVRAASDFNYVATGGSGTAFNVATGGYSTGVSATGSNYGVYSSVAGGFGVYAVNSGSSVSGHAGVYGGAGGSGNYGVHGVASGSTGTGVRGESLTDSGVGVNGEIPATVGIAPPVPNTATNTIAVYGNNLSTGAGGIGVYGTTGTFVGVYGYTTSGGTGTVGYAPAGTGLLGVSTSGVGVQAGSTNSYGLYASSTNSIGCFGQTSASGSFGILGTTTAPNSIALGGIANADGSSCFSGGTTNPNAFAAFFQGHVQVADGAFDVIPLGNKHGLAPHPDGTHRTFYSVESPECWVEDFGEGTIMAGKAAVKLDTDFATLVHTDHYHVFITEHDQHNALHVTNRTAGGFVVQADDETLKAKGKSAASVTGTFSWRVVAKPKTTANVERLAKAIVGDPKVLIPDAARLPPRPAKAPPSAPSTKRT